MTCWSLALWDPAALLKASLELSLSCTCWAHSSERNATPTPASFDRGPKYRHNKATDARVKSRSTWGVTSGRRGGSKTVRKGGGNHMYEFATIALLGLALYKVMDLVGALGHLSRAGTVTLTILLGVGLT